MAQEGGQERTEQPTPKRLKEAREKGQVARSRELNTMTILVAASGGLLLMGGQLADGISNMMTQGLAIGRHHVYDASAVVELLHDRVADALSTLLPLFALLIFVAILAPMALSGWSFSVQAMSFKWDRIDPIKGLGRVFSWKGLMELLKALAKFAIVATFTVTVLWMNAEELVSLNNKDVSYALADAMTHLGWSFLIISCSLIVVAAVDVPFQIWDHSRQLKMTRQEVKDEHKETDGNPEVKSHIRNLQRQMAQRRMMQEVPSADVVLTNPTHYAVALRYDQENMGAPRVVAKGADVIAGEIRKVAVAHQVPLVSSPTLTRALYYHTEINDEIPAGLYLAVAQILAYVYQLRARRGYRRETPISMPDVPVPTELRRD